MNGLSLVRLFFFTTVGCIIFSCPGETASFVPIFQWKSEADAGRNAEQKKSIEPSSSSIQLLQQSNQFRDVEKGNIPAWVGSDGLMRVPSTLAYWLESDTATSRRALSEHSDSRPYGTVVLPGISSSFQADVAQEQDVTEPVKIEEVNVVDSSTCRSRGATSSARHRWPMAYAHSDGLNPPVDSIDAYSDLLSPSITYEDGSDVFSYDFYDTSNSYPAQFDACEVDVPSGCHFESDPPGYLVCNDTSLTRVPADLPRHLSLSVFQLNNTSVQVVESGDFHQMDLVDMSLDSNPQLYVIERGAFDNVTSLLTLSIKHNSIESLDWRAFDGLDTLVVLSLRDNQIDLTGTFKDPPADDTCVLPKLIHLDLSENPLGALNRYVFWQLGQSPIEELNLKSCDISYIDPDAFEPLTSLLHVDFYNNPKLSSVFAHNTRTPILPPSIIQLGLGYNHLVQKVPVPLLQNVSSSLKTINLSGNLYFLLTGNLWPGITFSNLRFLILETCSISVVNATAFENMPQLAYLYMGKNQLTQVAPGTFPSSLQLLSVRQNPKMSGSFVMSKDNFAEMTELVWLDMNSMKLDSKNFSSEAFKGLNKLTILQMRDSGLAEIPARLFSPLTQLAMLDLGNNPIATLSHQFSAGLANTQLLFLDNCLLDFPVDADYAYQPFRGMRNLAMLYLTRNSINQFTPNLVANLTQLYLLHLSGNQLHTWDYGTTAYMPATAAISLSDNKIQFLPNQTFDEFSRIAAIDLSDNALICNCQILALQQLANSTNTTVINWEVRGAYTCTDTSAEPFVLKEIPLMTEEEFQCYSDAVTTPQPTDDKETATVVSSVVGAVIIVITLVAIMTSCYCKRNQRHGKWYHVRQQLPFGGSSSSDVAIDNDSEFEYDAFISFNEQDRPWVYTHLVPQLERSKESSDTVDSTNEHFKPFRLCIHDRDFTVGQRITENIIENIAKSRKVVIVLSRGYVESKWCQFELDLSHHRLLESERRNALVLVLLEEVPKQQQNAGLRYLMSTRTYLEWRSDPEGQKLFWQRLRQVLTVPQHSADPVLTVHAST
ncbi:toll-like receptor 13 [Daphnia carinata]|uniref:toll-like receptor 13 n=1 Tax=Daphnia carinata TaxID=120202 RepID=UPI002868A001|nr:toll-like receptor 13 [Daphnia carinata]